MIPPAYIVGGIWLSIEIQQKRLKGAFFASIQNTLKLKNSLK